MQIKDIQRLIDNPLQPNPAEWAMDVEDILSETETATKETDHALHLLTVHNGAFPQYTDLLVATLKRVIKKIEKSSDNTSQGDSVVMSKENVFIVYAHQDRNMMLDIKDFIHDTLGFEPKTLDISDYAGSVWDAFTSEVSNCEKAIVLMSEDDTVTTSDGKEYRQARPNVFIELGYMIHKCELKNIVIVYSGKCYVPSDIQGLSSVLYGADKWTESLRKQLNR